MSNVWYSNGRMTVRGKSVDSLLGRSSFKWAVLVSYHYSGQGGMMYGGALAESKRWIEHNQKLFNREDVVLRVFAETGAWRHVGQEEGMFGSPPWDQRQKNGRTVGIWNVDHLRSLCARSDRVRNLTALNLNVMEEAFRQSHESGCVFEWVIDATLKHTTGLCTGVVDHIIRQTGIAARDLQELYPNAAFLISARNEFNAHNGTRTTLAEVNRWAERWYRWKSADTGETRLAHSQPSPDFEAEQWPEAMFIIDQGGEDVFEFDCGPEPGKFKMAAVHPQRKGTPGRDWKELPDMYKLRSLARGQPIGAPESMYFVSKKGTEGWYRNRSGWNGNIKDQIEFYENVIVPDGFRYFIVHDDIGAQTSTKFNPGSKWEGALAEFLGGKIGGIPDPPPPITTWPPTDSTKRPYDHHVVAAYKGILGRDPDEDSRASYNDQLERCYDVELSGGMTVEGMRDTMRGSDEHHHKNDGPWNYR